MLSNKLICFSLPLIYLLKITSSSRCSDKPEGLFKLSPPQREIINVDISETTMRMVTAMETVSTKAVKLSRYHSRCLAEWSAASEYADCGGNTEVIPLTNVEVKSFSKKGKCMAGQECNMEEGCSGGGSEACHSNERKVEMDPKMFETNLGSYTKAWYSTCVQHWECLIPEVKLRVRSAISSGMPSFVIVWSTGEEITLTDEEQIVLTSDGFYLIIPPLITEIFSIKAKCLKKDLESTCMASETVGRMEKGSTFLLNEQGLCAYESSYFQSDMVGVTSIKIEKHGESSSIESLYESIMALKYSHHQSIYNSFQITKRIQDIEDRMIDLIKIVDKTSNHLISGMLNGTFKTKWINDEVFSIYPCDGPAKADFDSCTSANLKTLEGWSIDDKNVGISCLLGNNSVQPLALFDGLSLDSSSFVLPTVTNSDRQKIKDQIDQYERKIEKENKRKEDIKNNFVSSSNFGWISTFFLYLGASCGIISVILQILGCRRG